MSARVLERRSRQRLAKSMMLQRRGDLGVNERQLGFSQAQEQESHLLIHSNLKLTVLEIQLDGSTHTADHDVAHLFDSHVRSVFS
jgi:hypothetical protein